jgi:hypothetical protein
VLRDVSILLDVGVADVHGSSLRQRRQACHPREVVGPLAEGGPDQADEKGNAEDQPADEREYATGHREKPAARDFVGRDGSPDHLLSFSIY